MNLDVTIVKKDKEFKSALNQVDKAVIAVNQLTVNNEKDEASAIQIGSKLKQVEKVNKEQLKKWTGGAEDYVKTVKGLFKPKLDTLKSLQNQIKSKLIKYRYDVEEEVRKQNEKIAAQQAKQLEKQEKKISEAIEKGKTPPVLKPIIQQQIEIKQTTKTDTSAKVTYRTVKGYEVESMKLLCKAIADGKFPEDYVIINAPRINAAMKAGIKVDGIKYTEKKTPVIY